MTTPQQVLRDISPNEQTLLPGLGRSATGHDNEAAFDSPNLRVTVISTTEKGTVAALRMASDLAKNLAARITLVSTRVIPLQFSLEKPPVSVPFLQNQLSQLVTEAGINSDEVVAQLWLCRDEEAALSQVLTPRSLLVIGGSKHWWGGREERLERYLIGLGHQVFFVPAKGRGGAEIGGRCHTDRRSGQAPKGRMVKTKVA